MVTVFRSPTGFRELELHRRALPAFDPGVLLAGSTVGGNSTGACVVEPARADPLEAAGAVIEAMRSGCGQSWDFYRTDDDDDPLTEELRRRP